MGGEGEEVRAEGSGLGEEADEGDTLAEGEEVNVGKRGGRERGGGYFQEAGGDAYREKATDAVRDEQGFLSGVSTVALEDVLGHGVDALVQLGELSGAPAVDERKGAQQPEDAEAVGPFECGHGEQGAQSKAGGAARQGRTGGGPHPMLSAEKNGAGAEPKQGQKSHREEARKEGGIGNLAHFGEAAGAQVVCVHGQTLGQKGSGVGGPMLANEVVPAQELVVCRDFALGGGALDGPA